MPPMPNATVLKVETPGSSDDFFSSGAGSGVQFEGAMDAVVEDRRQRQLDATGSNVVVWRSLVVDDRWPVAFDTGQVVTYIYAEQQLTGRVQAVERNVQPQIPSHLRTIRLTFEPA